MNGGAATPGVEERKVARGAMLQQASQIWGACCMLAVVTLVGRHFGPRGFGGYTLITSFAAAVATVQVAVDGVAVRSFSLISDARARSSAFSTVCALYGVLGVFAGVAVVGIGLLVIGLVSSFSGQADELREAVFAIGAVTVVGWPARASREALRADHRFGVVAVAESAAFSSLTAGVAALVVANAPLWAVATVASSMNVFAGLYCWAMKRIHPEADQFRFRDVSRTELAALLRTSLGLAALGLADLLTYSLDPTILGAFRGPRTVGLYGAAARPPNLLYQMTGSLALIVVPVAATYNAAEDTERIHDLLLRGTRYLVAATAPIAAALIVISGPLLRLWLGHRYGPAAPALAIASSYWLVTASTSIIVWHLFAAHKMRSFFRYAWSVTISNLALSLILTWQLGLVGVMLGTALPAVIGFGFLTAREVRELPVSLRELASQAWWPGWAIAAIVGAILLLLRLVASPTDLAILAAEALGALGVGWAVYWRCFLSSSERSLALSLARNPFRAPPGSSS